MSVKNRLTKTRALALLREVVAEHGEGTVYDKGENGLCQYVKDGAPSCLVGHVLIRHGFAVDTVAAMDSASSYGSVNAGELPNHLKLVTREAAWILDAAQGVQDCAGPWGEALATAEDYARENPL